METAVVRKTRGLTAYQIKIIALVLMTIDHLGAYGFEIPVFSTYNSYLRLIGRLAMPLFLFALSESIRYTRSKPKFLLRLYLAAVGTGLFTSVTNLAFEDTVGRFSMSNIFYTYFYVALYAVLIENLWSGLKGRDWKKLGSSAAGIAATVGIHFLYVFLMDIDFMGMGLSLEYSMFVKDLIQSVIESPWLVEYTMLFVLMGVLMYFARSQYAKAAVLLAFSILCYAGGCVRYGTPVYEFIWYTGPWFAVMGSPQCFMALAAPIMLLYNGQKGKSCKWFFYWYYPVHRYVISVVEYLYLVFWGA